MPGIHDLMVDDLTLHLIQGDEPISEPTEADFEKRKRELEQLEQLVGDLELGSEPEMLILERLLGVVNGS